MFLLIIFALWGVLTNNVLSMPTPIKNMTANSLDEDDDLGDDSSDMEDDNGEDPFQGEILPPPQTPIQPPSVPMSAPQMQVPNDPFATPSNMSLPPPQSGPFAPPPPVENDPFATSTLPPSSTSFGPLPPEGSDPFGPLPPPTTNTSAKGGGTLPDFGPELDPLSPLPPLPNEARAVPPPINTSSFEGGPGSNTMTPPQSMNDPFAGPPVNRVSTQPFNAPFERPMGPNQRLDSPMLPNTFGQAKTTLNEGNFSWSKLDLHSLARQE